MMDDTHCEIIVNPLMRNTNYRSVSIDGKVENIIDAFKKIDILLEERMQYIDSNKLKDQENASKGSLNHTTAKFIFKAKAVDYLVGKRGDFIRSLCNKFDVTIKFREDKSLDYLHDDENITVINGKLENI